MAVTLSDPVTSPEAALSELTYSFAIQKFARDDDGDLVVSGVATDGSVDSDRQIVDEGWSGSALSAWKATGANVRMAHDPRRPIGKGLRLDINKDGDGKHWVHSVVVDRDAQRLIEKGVLTAYSVGIANPVIKRDPSGRAAGGIICGGEIAELSIVDRPANKSAYLQIAKAAGSGVELTGRLFAPKELIASAAAEDGPGLTSVDLPSDMKLRVTPAVLAKMQTLKRNLVLQEQAAVAPGAAEPDGAPGPEAEPGYHAMKAAEAAVYKRDIGTDERRRLASEGKALPNLSYPIETAGDLENAATLARTGHGDVKGARRLIARRAKDLGVPDPLKKKPKVSAAVKAAAVVPAVVKCMKCDGSEMVDGKPCPECKPAKAAAPQSAKKKGKMRAVCPGCGAKQNPAHVHCPECGGKLPERPLMVKKNHEFMCLGCGKELDKGEPHCPGCGKENPGYLPEADRKIPANMDADKSAGKDRVAKAKKKSGKKGKMPFGGSQAKPFGSGDDKEMPGGKAEKRKGKGRNPAEGVTGHDTAGLPPHREPDGAPVEAFENDARLEDGDQQMKAAMRHKTLGVEPHLAVLHDLTCPAFSIASVGKALPHASLAGIDTAWWSDQALKAAAGSDMAVAMQNYNEAQALSKAAVMLKMADPDVMDRIRMANHDAFLQANADLLGKTFRDATPGPGTAPTPGHVMPQTFRRPYLTEGHAAESPQAEPARTFPVISDHPQAMDFQRGYLSEGHAAQSPDNSEPRSEPVPAGTAGRPESAASMAAVMQARDYASAVSAMHDHLSRIAPGMCPMSPPMGSTQKPGHPVPDHVGAPVPHKAKASKADKAAARAAVKARRAKKAARAAARKAEARRRKVQAQVLKGRLSVDDGRVKLGLEPFGTPETAVKAAVPALPAGEAPAAPLDAETLATALKAATAPLVKRIERQDKALRKNQKVLDAIAGQPDTSQAPFRGAGVYKASAAVAPPRTAAEAAELAQTVNLQMLHKQMRESTNPAEREAARREYTARVGTAPMTGAPDTTHPFRT